MNVNTNNFPSFGALAAAREISTALRRENRIKVWKSRKMIEID